MQRRKRKRKKKPLERIARYSGILLLLVIILGIFYSCRERAEGVIDDILHPTKKVGAVEVRELFLTPNEYSRPQTKLKKVNGIVIHYTANPGSTAENNRDYFEGLKDSQATYASSHYIIGIEGEIIQCIPLDEIAYASNKRNNDTISIECCHEDKTGAFTDKTRQSLVKLVAWLCGKYNLKENDIIRHYDVTGKCCPKYYVEHEEKWIQLKTEIFAYIEQLGK